MTESKKSKPGRDGKKPTHKTDYQLKQILKYNRDGSPGKQTERLKTLLLCVSQLQARGYGPRWDLHKLGKKEVSRLVDGWRTQGIRHRTIANRMAEIRWLADKVGRLDQIPSNKDVGIGLRKNDPNYGQNKAQELDRDKLQAMPTREQLITELRREFGLRTEEAVKFQHRYATHTPGQIRLMGSWCKGGRPRTVPIVNAAQVDLLKRVEQHQAEHRDKSMIPRHRTFKSYYRDYNEIREAAGVPGHELRHQWAQERFKTVSGGIAARHAGGPKRSELSEAEQQRWNKAAATVNQELGHGQGRQDITATYIGAR